MPAVLAGFITRKMIRRGALENRGEVSDFAGGKKKKGCGIGYALAASSCEGASRVDACTVAALDATTAFAVPNPSCSSQGSRFFRVWWLDELPRQVDHPAYFGLVNITWINPFQPSTVVNINPPDPKSCDGGHKCFEQLCIYCDKSGLQQRWDFWVHS